MKVIRPDYKNSIMNVSNSFLHYYHVPTNYPGISELDIELKKDYNHIIYVLLDGMGSNIVKHHLKPTQALRQYMRQEITSVFPPTTVAATNAVLSGLPPITTGYLGWVQYFPKEDTDLIVFLNKDFYTETPQKEILRDKYLPYDNICTKIHKQNPNIQTNVFFPAYIGGVTESFEDAVEKVLLVTHNTDQSFNYVYWVQPDLIEHTAGIYSHDVKEMMENLNATVEDLFQNIADDTLVVILADHGLTDVKEINFFQYDSLTNMLKRKPSIEPRATNFFIKDEFLLEFKEEFNKYFSSKYILMNRQEFMTSNLMGEGEKHPLVDTFIGDYIAIAIDHYMISLTDKKMYKAHHAGLLEDEMMVPLIIYSKK